MVNTNWPLVIDNFAFTGDPNDPSSTPTYTDLSARVRTFEASRGRQYEIDQNQTGTAHLTVSDKDEVLNPANTSAPAPFAGNIKPYRRYLRQAMWPPVPVGAATNLLPSQGIDPSFESYTAGVQPSWVLAVGSGVSPTVQAATPWQGTKSLQYSVTAGGGTNGVGWAITCIPGQQYTASAWVRQTGGNSTQIFIDGGASGSTTTTTATYVRLTVTFVATAPSHNVWVASFGTSVTGTVNIDALQHEPAATASAFATSGPTIYTPFAGYVERWPSTWNHQGTYGMCALACVDAMAVLAGTDMHTEYRSAVLNKNPAYYWPLSEPSGAATFGEASGNSGTPLIRADAQAGPATSFGSGQTNIPGDTGGSGLAISNTATVGSWVQTGTSGTFTAAAPAAPWSMSAAFWFINGNPSSNNFLFSIFNFSWTNTATALYLLQSSATRTQMGVGPSDGSLDFISFNTLTLYDGKPHHVVATVNLASSTSLTYSLWVDGAQQMTRTINPTTTFVGSQLNFACTQINVGAYMDPYVATYPQFNGESGTYAHAAVWNRLLSDGDIADLWTAGKGYPGETSGQRISRLLALGGYTGPTAIDTGQSTMGVSTITEGAALLDACQQATLSENGNLYVEAGTVTAKSRTDRYLKLTPKWVFGERADLGEYPYEKDIAYDYDPSRVVNDVSVSRVGGIKATAKDDASQKQYFRRSYLRTIGIQSDNETTDAANYLLNKGRQPIQRVSHLSIKPSANPALWPVALGIRIGDRVTVKRRTPAFTMSSDFFVEKVEHSTSAGSWVTSLQMSPVDRTSVWILGDPVYGQLGITSILGY